jgi:hypothetical protein
MYNDLLEKYLKEFFNKAVSLNSFLRKLIENILTLKNLSLANEIIYLCAHILYEGKFYEQIIKSG